MSEARQDEQTQPIEPPRLKWNMAFYYLLRELGKERPPAYTRDWGMYYEVFGPIVDYEILPKANRQLRELISGFYERESGHVRGRRLKKLVDKFCNLKPLEGRKILEIGGNFGELLHLLGADCVCIDPWATRTIEKSRFKVVIDPLTPENFGDLIGNEKFDITYSRLVLDWGSGLAPFDKQKDDFVMTCQKMLWMAAEATREGGISIHVGNWVPVGKWVPGSDEMLRRIDLKLEARVPGNAEKPEDLNPGDIYIFRKVEQQHA